MNELTIINKNGVLLADSREVATMTGKRHDHLMRDIDGYVNALGNSTDPNFGVSDFFIETTYKDSTGRTLKRYDITKLGCDMVANKMTGQKGVLFTATYVTRFNEMETLIQSGSRPRRSDDATLSHFKKEAYMLEVAADMLRLPDSGRLKLLGDFNKQKGLEVPLPAYADEPITKSATVLLKEHGLNISTQAFNVLLVNEGLVEIMKRPSRSGGDKEFKSLTEEGTKYGKNIISPNNPRETAPHYFPDKFIELLERLGLGV